MARDYSDRDRLRRSFPDAVAVVIQHGYYGCDSGCCGTELAVVDGDGYSEQVEFDFSHEANFNKEAAQLAEALGVPVRDTPELRQTLKECW